MDRNANPTPKTDTVPTPVPEPDSAPEPKPDPEPDTKPKPDPGPDTKPKPDPEPEPDEAFRQKMLQTLTELYTDGDLEFMVRGYHKTHITGSVTHTIGSTLLTRVGGSEIDAVGGSYLATSPQRAVFNGAEQKISALAFRGHGARVEAVGLKTQTVAKELTLVQIRRELVQRMDHIAQQVNQLAARRRDLQCDRIDIVQE